jgi:hypothetical protein
MSKVRDFAEIISAGIAADDAGLGNVTNESKATMFTSPTFTGTPTGITAAHLEAGVLPSDVTGGSGLTSPLQKAGGTMTGTIAGFTSTGIDDNATSTAITIDSSENVGIGTTGPSTKLQVAGDITATAFAGSGANLTGIDAATVATTAPSSPVAGDMWFDSTAGTTAMKVWSGTAWDQMSNKFTATGGTITTFGAYKLHVFTSSGTFTAEASGSVDVLVVAGGGAGNAAGGGAGGLVYTANHAVTAQDYTITVGGGGAAKAACGSNCGTNHGVNSSAFGITANKGMGANGWDIQASTTMNVYGSGAGSGHSSTGPYVASGYTTGQGHAGGAENVNVSPYPGSGGGGAGGAGGATSSNTVQGAGGAGLNYGSTFGTSVGDGGWFASGGVGSCHSGGCAAAYAPSGGGGDNTDYVSTNANRNGLANSGGGGAGAHNGGISGAGGSGVVIVRYLI